MSRKQQPKILYLKIYPPKRLFSLQRFIQIYAFKLKIIKSIEINNKKILSHGK